MGDEDVNVMLGRLDERFKNIVQTLQVLQGEIVTQDEMDGLSKRLDGLEGRCGELQTKEAAQALGQRVGNLETGAKAVIGATLMAVLAAVLTSVGLE